MKKSNIKSAYELAMERLEKEQGKADALTDKQKAALAEIDQQTQARRAEVEIMMNQRLAEARAHGDAEAVRQLEEQRTSELRKAQDDGEDRKERIRSGRT